MCGASWIAGSGCYEYRSTQERAKFMLHPRAPTPQNHWRIIGANHSAPTSWCAYLKVACWRNQPTATIPAAHRWRNGALSALENKYRGAQPNN
jgi:hypothetical protein